LHLLALSRAVAGFCATGDRESSQGRKAAALSGFACVPQVTWLLRTTAPEVFSGITPGSAVAARPAKVPHLARPPEALSRPRSTQAASRRLAEWSTTSPSTGDTVPSASPRSVARTMSSGLSATPCGTTA